MEKTLLTVAKFGGSSLSSATQFKKVKKIVESSDTRNVIVVSAVGRVNPKDSKITDLLYLLYAHLEYSVPYDDLFDMIKNRYLKIKEELQLNLDIEKSFNDLKKELNNNIDVDYLVSRGEYFSAKLMSEYLGYEFIDAKELIAFHYNGKINMEKTKENIGKVYASYKHIVVPGFYGSYSNKKVHLMSRGGSDITGAIIARSLNVNIYENWTDVSGILMADPKIIKNPKQIKEITYDELREMSYMGAKVLHEETIIPVQELNIPINILNTNIPENPGTLILEKCNDTSQIITGITGKKSFMAFTINEVSGTNKTALLSKVLDIFDKFGVVVEYVPGSIDSFSIIVSYDKVKSVMYDIISEIKQNDQIKSIDVDDDMALVAVIGRNMVTRAGISGRIFGLIGNNNINIKMISQGAVEFAIIFGVSNSDFKKTIKVLYDNLV